MPQGKGTYGSKVGRPPKKKKADTKKGKQHSKQPRKIAKKTARYRK